MIFPEIESNIQTIIDNITVYGEKNFDARTNAIDFLEFHTLDQIDTLRKDESDQNKLTDLQHQAEKVKSQLEEIDNKLFQRFPGYARARGLPEPEMVFYQKTPARIVFELVKKAGFTKDDVFFDIGSGLGQAAMLVNLLTSMRTVGVEFEPAFCEYSEKCAITLGLQDVAFFNVDAREADYSEGTVFFMYMPFRGKMLLDVSDLLRKELLKRWIRVITYGPCTAGVARQKWVHADSDEELNNHTPAFFNSL